MAVRKASCLPAALVFVASSMFFVWVPSHSTHPPIASSRNAAAAERAQRPPLSLPVTPARAHGQAWALYDAFAAEGEGCATATLVAQLEGDPSRRLEILEDAGLREWNARRTALRAEHPDCPARAPASAVTLK